MEVGMKWKKEMRQIPKIHPRKSETQFSFQVSSSQHNKGYIILTQLKMSLRWKQSYLEKYNHC